MSGPPTVLLRVKSVREQAAMRRMKEARAAVTRAEEELTAKRQQLDQHRAKRPARERALYDQILHQEVSLGDVEVVNARIARLRQWEQELMEEAVDLERAHHAACAAEREAHGAWQAAQREVQKVEEMLADWRSKEQQRVERQAELELEEYTRPRGRAGHREGAR